MKGQITKVEAHASKKTNKTAYLVCFKCEDGKSRRSWIDSGYRNYSHWDGLLFKGCELDNLAVIGNTIDADSYPKRIVNAKPEEVAEDSCDGYVQEKLF